MGLLAVLGGATGTGIVTLLAPVTTSNQTLTLPDATDTVAGIAATQTLTNKSIVATQLTGTIAAARLPAGSVLQVVNVQTGAVATGTTIFPFDDTIPQNTEGNQYMSLAVTPTSATSVLRIEIVANLSNSGAGPIGAALFQDSTANALAATVTYTNEATTLTPAVFSHYMTAGTTSATTFKFRAGPDGANTITFNGRSSARLLGGVLASSMTITEIAA